MLSSKMPTLYSCKGKIPGLVDIGAEERCRQTEIDGRVAHEMLEIQIQVAKREIPR